MNSTPRPVFESHSDFVDQDFNVGRPSIASVQRFLEGFASEVEAITGFLAIRGYLRCYADNALTYSTYRGHVERLFLWSLIVRKKPVHVLKRLDAEAFLEFCKHPPATWVGPVIRNRFIFESGTQALDSELAANPKWKPFTLRAPKQTRISADNSGNNQPTDYHSSTGSMSNVFKIANGFYEYLVEEEIAGSNPFRKVAKKGQYRSSQLESNTSRALTPLQWDYVIDTAEAMAAAEPEKHERTLFILVTMFSMYLRISDMVGRSNWQPTMGDFRLDADGNWWLHVVGKGNKSGKIAVRDEYVNKYLTRYRTFIGLSSLPTYQEKTPLLKTLSGRAGLSDRQVRALLQAVFDQALSRMREEGREPYEMDSLRSASSHWLRHTSATFDAPFRNAKDLQYDLRHSNLATTQNTYYHSHDQERARSVKHLGTRDRG
ncbi:site-specific integrase [Pseudomonas syringae]|nr:site-specific integrase [Pseudomonas syringae]EPM65218.1 site-specific recombinase, phage integrase family protein [Pseudomonas syringae pv. actinidiae ICMP 18804]EPN14252.1 site-specific recombinase, phage integrase family protein [Pseudomonas syringae pv. actinidiae ICMP 19100]EPN25231.1 site-specific recombinase, phage integrase family protein [Pseudomonas syringae pv. actinidiae ICMP 19099]EPN38665.1 site-specific recombinase, phage integrase family protein [Pseudomonas syringae pv. acti